MEWEHLRLYKALGNSEIADHEVVATRKISDSKRDLSGVCCVIKNF